MSTFGPWWVLKGCKYAPSLLALVIVEFYRVSQDPMYPLVHSVRGDRTFCFGRNDGPRNNIEYRQYYASVIRATCGGYWVLR